jgi:hypothetical protein
MKINRVGLQWRELKKGEVSGIIWQDPGLAEGMVVAKPE